MKKLNPIDLMMKYRDVILSVHEEAESPKKAWGLLRERLPGFCEGMSFNTFKQYFVPFVKISTGLEAEFKARYGIVEDSQKVKNIMGWTVQKGRDGYYRLFKKIGGRVHGIYLGRALDVEKAQARIRAKEKALGLDEDK